MQRKQILCSVTYNETLEHWTLLPKLCIFCRLKKCTNTRKSLKQLGQKGLQYMEELENRIINNEREKN